MSKRVAILGGGVAGMTAAHELIERGFEVDVYERQRVAGGKARSVKVPGSAGLGPGALLPGEHGFRFFPGFYKHVPDTMKRIPCGSRATVFDNLVTTTRIEIVAGGTDPIVLPAVLPRSRKDLDVIDSSRARFGALGIPAEDIEFYKERLWQVLTSCTDRRIDEYEKLGWWHFIGADTRSPEYSHFMAEGLTRSLVAAKARKASARTNGDILLQLIFNTLERVGADRVLNGPTNDVWIDPWLDYITRRGARYHTGVEVLRIDCTGGRITGVRVRREDGTEATVTADYYLSALPVERLAALLTEPITAADPTLTSLPILAGSVAWMNGIQFYLTEDVKFEKGHQIYIDSKWALTSLSQAQFWPNTDLSTFVDGGVRGILSVDISDWEALGWNGKAAKECTADEIANEVWLQLEKSLTGPTRKKLDRSMLYGRCPYYLDDDIRPWSPGREAGNREPLLVNEINTWHLRPNAYTRIPNFFLAGDYVRTYTDLATMEGANESARRAANAIIDAAGGKTDYCTLWKLHEPYVFALWRWHDQRRYDRGLPWHEDIPGWVATAQHLVNTGIRLWRLSMRLRARR